MKATQQSIEKLTKKQLDNLGPFLNYHGITAGNINEFLVTPYRVMVDPDDGISTELEEMWVVLHEYGKNSTKERPGYMAVYIPSEDRWGIAERHFNGLYILTIVADSFEDALDGM